MWSQPMWCECMTHHGRPLPKLHLQVCLVHAVCGIHAGAVSELLQSGGLSCKTLDRTEYTKCMLEKLIWIWCGPPCLHEPCQSSQCMS